MTNERAETHACDCISRVAAIDALIRKIRPHNNGDGTITMCVMSEELVGKTLNDLPSAQPKIEERKEESAQNVSKEDLISRKAAIDAVNGVIADYIPTLYGRYEALPLEMAKAIKRLPTAQSEIVRCGACKYFKVEYAWNCASYPICEVSPQRIITPDDYCSFAERRTE